MDCDGSTNKSLQEEEIQAMYSIFDSEWQVEDPFKNNSFSMKISNSSGNNVFFKVSLPEEYPLNSPPQYLISAPWMSREAKNRLARMLEDIYCDNVGNCVLYQWVIKIQDFIGGEFAEDSRCDESKNLLDFEEANASQLQSHNVCKTLDNLQLPENDELFPITHGEIIQDKKSVFQGHVAKVLSVDQVKKVLNQLKENRKIATATHNILAYRIEKGPKLFIQDCDDDGETRGGSTLLHLLQILDVKDVVVIVSRWYGGIHLGPDRFKDISNAARKALLAAGFIQEKVKVYEKKHHKGL